MSQSSVAAQDSRSVATVAGPAVVTATGAPLADQGVASQPPRVIISVTGFRPPRDGAVQAVVKVQKSGDRTEQEIGRFGIYPNAEFKAADPSKAQRFGLPLPKELASGGAVKLHVYLVPRFWRSAAPKSVDWRNHQPALVFGAAALKELTA